MTSLNTVAVRTDLERFAPIALDELVGEAALMTRVDRKYLLRENELERFCTRLPGDTRVLEIDRRRVMDYHSLYFDTPGLRGYRSTAQGRRRRFKVRVRTYADTGARFLEVKTKGLRGSTVKERMDYDGAPQDRLTPPGLAFVDDTLASAGIPDVTAADLVPVVESVYRRTTLFLPSSGSRCTVDTALTWRAWHGTELDGGPLAIVETKAGQRPGEADRALWSLGHRPQRCSKYGLGLAALHRRLPSNKWHRARHEHFASD